MSTIGISLTAILGSSQTTILNGGVSNSTASAQVTGFIPNDGQVSFYSRISSEGGYDFGRFYIDGQEMENWSGAGNWEIHTYEITAGEHTFKWAYTKDVSVNGNEDCFYVDNINFINMTRGGTRAVDHFEVYRFDYSENSAWELLADNVTDTSYVDSTWSALSEGWYKYGVVASYASSDTIYAPRLVESNKIFKPYPHYLGDGGTTINEYLPSYSYYKYTLSQQIYTASEIRTAGLISSVSFFNDGAEKTRIYDIYMVHTDKTTFDNNTDWIAVTEADHVYSGTVTMVANAWTTLQLDIPFAYNGTSNLALIVDDNSGNFTGSPHMQCRVYNTNGTQAIRVYSDGTNYDPFNPSGYNGTRHSVKNQIILGFSSTCHFIIAGNWSTASNWSNGTLPQTVDEVFIDAPCQLDQDAKVAMLTVSGGQSLTLQSGQTLTVTNTLDNTSTSGLIIEDGAQLVHASENVSAMVKKNIAGHGTSNGKYCLISSPLTEAVDPEMSNVYHLLRGSYDLYDWLPSASDRLEWRNFKDNNFMMYPEGFGYLYANRNGVELNFPGILNPSRYRFGKAVSYDSSDTEHPGWNLIGNPFMCNAKLVNANNEPVSYYRMNAAGDGFVADTSGAIAPMEGVFYQASENGTVYFVRADNTSQIPTFTISVSASPSDGGSVNGGGTYQQGQAITLGATANDGFIFVNWTENGEMVSTDVNYTFTVDGDRVLVANFTGDHAYVDLGLPSGLLWATCNEGHLQLEHLPILHGQQQHANQVLQQR